MNGVVVSAAGWVLGQGVAPPEHDVDEVDRRIDEILARSEFQPPEPTWLRRQWDRFVDWLRSLVEADEEPPVPDIPAEPAGGGGPGSLVAFLLLAAVLVLVAWVIWRIVRDRTPRAASDDDDIDVTVVIDERRTASDWRSRAGELEADGRWKEAVRAWLRWGVTNLIDRGVLEDVPGRTTGEYRRFVADQHPGLRADFDRATRLFDEIWYADRTATAESAAGIRRDMERVIEAAPERGRLDEPDPDRPLAEIS